MVDITKVTVSNENIHIEDSYLVLKSEFDEVFDYVKDMYPDNLVIKNRSRFVMKMEWACHNFCSDRGWWINRTKDVDLNYPQAWYHNFWYTVLGLIAYPFID